MSYLIFPYISIANLVTTGLLTILSTGFVDRKFQDNY